MAVYAVAARLQSIDNGMAWPGAASTVRVPSTTGGWLLIHASHLNSSAHGEIAVIIEPAHPRDVVTLLLNSQGLTPRERDVALLVLRGASTQAIGAELHLSVYTVKDHLKSIFDRPASVAAAIWSPTSSPASNAGSGRDEVNNLALVIVSWKARQNYGGRIRRLRTGTWPPPPASGIQSTRWRAHPPQRGPSPRIQAQHLENGDVGFAP